MRKRKRSPSPSAMREALEQPGKSAALVTPDRALARRVIAALARWHIAVDDSGGDALADTPAGVFARLAARAALNGLEPVTLLALLKHPLLRLGADAAPHGTVSVLERAMLARAAPEARHATASRMRWRPSATRATACIRSDPRNG